MTYSPSKWKRLRTRTARGFTLIEMMVVVAIIAMMAALAAPSVINIIRDNRSQKDALSLLVMVQDAHSRAYGRGGAVILTYNEGAAGAPDSIDIRERMQDIDADTVGDLPWPQCSTGVLSPVLKYWQTSDPDQPTDVGLTMNGQSGVANIAAGNSQAFCFQPRGRALAFLPVVPPPPPPAPATTWQILTDVATFQFTAASTTKQRFVLIYPNGSSRFR